ncbi:hypothetical protein [Kitasatospora purpeofusca]
MSEQCLSAFAAEEVEWLVGELLPDWTANARERGRGLLILRDGGK